MNALIRWVPTLSLRGVGAGPSTGDCGDRVSFPQAKRLEFYPLGVVRRAGARLGGSGGPPELSTSTSADFYRVLPAAQAAFEAEGWVRLPGVLTPVELAPLREVFERFRRGEVPVPGRDFCDMAGG